MLDAATLTAFRLITFDAMTKVADRQTLFATVYHRRQRYSCTLYTVFGKKRPP